MTPRNWFILLLLGFVALACNQGQDIQKDIERLEAKMETENNAKDATTLSGLYQSYVDSHPEDHELNGRYLYRAAGLEYRMNNAAKALELTRVALKNHYASSNTLNNAALMEKIYRENLGNPAIANTIAQALKEVAPNTEASSTPLPANLPPAMARLDTLRKNIFNNQTYGINFPVANNYVVAVESYVLVNPKHPQAPSLLFKAGEVARSIQTYSKALELLSWINDKYPESEENPQALFLKAFTLDDGLKQFDEARAVYEEFIQKYPNDPFADDAQFSLDNLGKDVNELIENFDQQNQ